MKKILIIDKSLDVGGIQTSLINLCKNIESEFTVDLFIYFPNGKLKGQLPSNINIIRANWLLETFGMSFAYCMKNGSFKQKLFRLFCTIWTKIFDNRLPIYLACKGQPILKNYDVAIAYHHEAKKNSLTSGFIRVMNSCIEAKKKISWIHNDYSTNELDEQFNDKYYRSVDEIVAVSKAVKEAFVMKHPSLSDKTTYCYNFLDYNSIVEKSNENTDCEFINKDKFICFSACRLHPIKAIVRAIKAIGPVLKCNEDVIWYIAGEGEDRVNVEREIAKQGLEKSIILLGNQSNPYKFMAKSNLIMLLSYSEAAPMVYSEAKFLGLPIFTTNISSSYELLGDAKNAYICENSLEAIRNKFIYIISNKEKIKEENKVTKYNYKDVKTNLNRFKQIVS